MSVSIVPSEEAKAEAAEWLARLNKLDTPAEDLEAFRLWRKAPGNKEAYDQVDAFWRRSKGLQSDPDIQDAIAATLSKTSSAKPRRTAVTRPVLGLGFAVAALLVLGGVGYRLWAPQQYGTAVGQQLTVRLDDGSTIILDTHSKVSVRMTRSGRDIRLLRGQAMFDVAHDPARPFVVTAGETSVTALGTRFDVRRENDGARVTLVRGAVEVRDEQGGSTNVWRLAPGQAIATTLRARTHPDSSPTATAPVTVDVDAATSWTSGRLVFRKMRLRDAVAEFNRYEDQDIQLDIGPLSDDTITGIFDVGDTKTFVGSLAELHDLTVSQPEKGVIRLSRAPSRDGAQ